MTAIAGRFFLCLIAAAACSAAAMETPFEAGGGNRSPTYAEGIAFYRELSTRYESVSMTEAGPTDSGLPLHLVSWAADPAPALPLAERQRAVVFINNAIHPGEPDGVDASMQLLRDLARDGGPDGVVVVVVPFYNIGGALNRNSNTRANQNGPEEYGFRGNARNLDLNRDFMKQDSRNAASFARALHALDPDVFVDTHVSNGANYQHVMTLLATQKDKLAAPLGEFLDEHMVPALTRAMAKRGEPIVPYVNVFGRAPDDGWPAFMDTPRYSSGYVSQFQTLAFMTETHMLKPYAQRVAATRAMLSEVVAFAANERDAIHNARRQARQTVVSATSLPIAFELQRDAWTDVDFRGFHVDEVRSDATGQTRLRYDESRPWRRNVRFYNDYRPSTLVSKPAAYLVRGGYWQVLERLENAGVAIERLTDERTFRAERYRIDSFDTVASPYEGHFLHRNTAVVAEPIEMTARPGDALIRTGSAADQYLINALEPAAPDSFFNWNFFDTILQRKEYFSGYVFEDIAAGMLARDAALAREFEKRRKDDAQFASDARAQLSFLFERSPHAEAAWRVYPVYRILSLPQED